MVVAILSSHLPALRAFFNCLWKQFRLPGGLDVHALKRRGRISCLSEISRLGPIHLVLTKWFSSDLCCFRKGWRRLPSVCKSVLINRVKRKIPKIYLNLISGPGNKHLFLSLYQSFHQRSKAFSGAIWTTWQNRAWCLWAWSSVSLVCHQIPKYI